MVNERHAFAIAMNRYMTRKERVYVAQRLMWSLLHVIGNQVEIVKLPPWSYVRGQPFGVHVAFRSPIYWRNPPSSWRKTEPDLPNATLEKFFNFISTFTTPYSPRKKHAQYLLEAVGAFIAKEYRYQL